jgi:hypothetical protein
MAGPPPYQLAREFNDPVATETRLARIEHIEDQIFDKAAQIVDAFLSFSEVTPNQTKPPPHWVEQYGEEGANQRLAVARRGWDPLSLAPAAAKYAAQTMVGISRGRSWRVRVTNNNLNVKLSLPAPTTREHPGPVTYEVLDVET